MVRPGRMLRLSRGPSVGIAMAQKIEVRRRTIDDAAFMERAAGRIEPCLAAG